MSIRRLWPLLILVLIIVLVGQIEAAPLDRVAVRFAAYPDQQWSPADRSEALVGVQRGLDLWDTGPRPLGLVAYDAGLVKAEPGVMVCAPVYHEELSVYLVETRPNRSVAPGRQVNYGIIGGRCAVVITDDGCAALWGSYTDYLAGITAHELPGHAIEAVPHNTCYADVMNSYPLDALRGWYVGDCTSRWLLEHL